MHLSIVVIAKNEEQRIEACLRSCQFGDELILLDSGSSDKTVEIARNLGAKVVTVKSGDFAELRNKGMSEAKGEWVLYVDADERVLKPLQDEIRELVAGSGYSAFALSRINIIFGQKVNYGPYKNDWMIRLFKKSDFETWVGKVHEYGKFKGQLGYSENSLLHLTHRDLDHFMQKALDWSKIDAKLRLDSGHPRMTKWRFIRILSTGFYNELFKRQGLFGGTVGIIDSVLQAFSLYLTYIRLWQLQQPKPLEDTYRDIDKKLIESKFEYKP
jgi:glycosyltransferase involved in cell wall biosynthesis